MSRLSAAGTRPVPWVVTAVLFLWLNLAGASPAFATGTETLGPIPVAGGTRIVGEGVGLVNQPATISFSVPKRATIEQVFAYWNGFDSNPFLPMNSITINGIEVNGTLIGGPTLFFGSSNSYTYRADITNLGIVTTGTNNIVVQGKDFDEANNGASIIAIIDEGGPQSVIDVRDGQDLAFINFAPPLDTTVPQTFNFAPFPFPRTAELTLIAGSVEGPKSGADPMRPNIARINIDGVVTDIENPLASTDGPEWDHLVIPVTVPAGASSLTIQLLSEDCCATGQLPASFTWMTAGLTILAPETGSVGDTVFCDIDNDGVQDPREPGVPGVTVTLACTAPDGSPFTATQVTDAMGKYSFTGVPIGNCTVSIDQATIPSDKQPGVCPLDFTIALGPGEDFVDADFCLNFKPGEIGDTVFCDLDDDGVQDPGEPGVPGITVNLVCMLIDGTILNTSMTTDANGNYLFTDVPPGSCTVTLDGSTIPADKEPGVCPGTFSVDLAADESFLDADFCIRFRPGEIGDTVFCDVNDNGVQDPSEPGVPGIVVNLDCLRPSGVPFSTTTTTDANGNYLFTDVPAGTCTVTVVEASVPADKELGSCPMEFDVDLDPGQSFLDADFCVNFKPGEIGDTVYCDLNDNGVQDAGEPGVAGVTVTLTCTLLSGEILSQSQMTNASGNYLFTNVPPGTCTVALDVASIPSDKEPGVCPLSFMVDLDPDESFLNADFCVNFKPGQIGDTVYCDLNDNGVQDAGEPGVPGVSVSLVCTLLDGSTLNQTQTTDANGNYLFTEIPPGACTVSLDVGTIPADKEPGVCPLTFSVDLAPAESFLDADFCVNFKTGEIGDTVYCDLNNNGVQDAGEPGVAGITVNLTCTLLDGSTLNQSQVTDASGNYLFTDIPPGTCTVAIDVSTIPSDKEPGVCPLTFDVTLAADQSFLDADFCVNFKPGEIGDTVYCDLNNNGVQDAGEPGVAGVTVNLVCTLLDGSTLNQTQATDANGNYLFADIPPGDCVVTLDVSTIPADKEPGVCPLTFTVDLDPAESFLDADFCVNFKPGEIGDTVYCDLNNNGVQDAGEPGVAGVTVNLACTLLDGSTLNQTQTTDANGNYLFADIPPGDCVVTLDVSTIPADKEPGVCPLTFTVDLDPAESFLDADFCVNFKPGEIGDTVYCDLNNNGVQDAGEPGVAGITVNLTCTLLDGSTLNQTQATDANGNYLFTSIPPGACTVTLDVSTIPADKEPGVCPLTFSVDLDPEESFLDADFCVNFKPGEIGDTVYCDTNNNGVQDGGEPGVAGVTVNLTCILLDGSTLSQTQVTDASGNYLFTDIPPGSCTVALDVSTIPADKEPGVCPLTVDVTLAADQSFLDADFCVNFKPGEIGDTVYCDLNNNGVQDAGEPGVPGVTVNLTCTLADGSTLSQSQATNASGNYLFTNIPPGSCTVTLDVNSIPADKQPGVCPITFSVALDPEESFLDADFCVNFKPGEIGDTVYCDLNDNGVQDRGEPGVPGITVNLTCTLLDGSPLTQSQVTDASGNYLFTNIPPGSCTVALDVSSIPADKEPGVCPLTFDVMLAADQSFLDADFCVNFKPGEIGDTVYCDTNDNGVQDAGEPGVAGVTVNLTCTLADGSTVNESQTTDANGNYLFTDLAPGACTVSLDLNTIPADKEPGVCPVTVDVTLAADQSFLDADFCVNFKPGEIGDTVYCDTNNNGVQDAGEPGVPGVTVNLVCTLVDGSTLTDTQATDANGNYLFTEIPPGDCVVSLDVSTIPADKEPGVCPLSFNVDLDPEESFLDADFCVNFIPGEIGDTVFCDLDDAGVQGPGEPGVPGVTISLVCTLLDGTMLNDSQVTDANGNYLFTNIPAGTCVVTLDDSTIPVDKEVGVCPSPVIVDLDPGESFLDADFCIRPRDVCAGTLQILWDLDLCYSTSANGSPHDYSEFTATATGVCDSVFNSASNVSRDSGGHSCTDDRFGNPGTAMCIGAPNLDNFVPDAANAVRFQIDVGAGSTLENLMFWEFAPHTYTWSSTLNDIVNTGPNNPPTLFGVRVLRDGVEIFLEIDIPTAQNTWTQRAFDFSGPDFVVDSGNAVFEFELLPYALDGSGSPTAWDLDDIKLELCCEDCDGDGIPNFQEPDCDGNGVADDCEIFDDCNGNGVPDACDIADGTSGDLDNNGIPDECMKVVCIDAAKGDNIVSSSHHAIWLDLGGGDIRRFRFDPPAELRMLPNGSATVTGTATDVNNASAQLVIDVTFTGRVNPGDANHPPAGSPHINSSSPALDSNGGPADPDDWYYYTDTSGTFTGAGSLAGLVLQIDRRGAAFQVGTGASLKNMHYGASGWLDLWTISQPNSGGHFPNDFVGDFNWDFVICDADGADHCSDATDLGCGLGNVDFDVTHATTDGSSSSVCHLYGSDQIYNDVWYRWTAPCDGDYRLSTLGLTHVDTKIAVYVEGPCGSLGDPVECDDEAWGTHQTVTNLWSTGGVTYLIRLGTYHPTQSGSGQMSISQLTAPCAMSACGD